MLSALVPLDSVMKYCSAIDPCVNESYGYCLNMYKAILFIESIEIFGHGWPVGGLLDDGPVPGSASGHRPWMPMDKTWGLNPHCRKDLRVVSY